MAHRKPRIDIYEPGQNVSLWLHRLNTERLLRGWQDPVAVAEANMLMGDIALTWFLNNCNVNTPWDDFSAGMKKRFGDNEQTVMARITHRKQREDETVQSYVDEMSMLFSQSEIPDAMKQDLMLDNLKPSLRKQVVATIPKTLEEVISNATYLEERANGLSSEKVKAWEKEHSHKRMDTAHHQINGQDDNCNEQQLPSAEPQ